MSYKTIIEEYREILDGKKLRFKNGTWREDTDRELARRITKYLVEEILEWDAEEIKKGWNRKLLSKYKLRGMLRHCYNGSPFAMIDDAYPNQFKPWEVNKTPRYYWTKETSLELLKWTIEEKEKLTDEELKKVFEIKWLRQHGLSTPLKEFWSTRPFSMLDDLYPGRFKPWEFQKVPNNFWTKEIALEALRWTIEEKEQLSEEQLKKVYCGQWIRSQRLKTPFALYWNEKAFDMLNELYPNRFSKSEIRGYRKNI